MNPYQRILGRKVCPVCGKDRLVLTKHFSNASVKHPYKYWQCRFCGFYEKKTDSKVKVNPL
jgi:C4-type Zn-finger protein